MLELSAQWTSKRAGKALKGVGRALEAAGSVSLATKQASEADGRASESDGGVLGGKEGNRLQAIMGEFVIDLRLLLSKLRR